MANMDTAALLNRALGKISSQSLQRYHTTCLLQALQPAPSVVFHGKYSEAEESHKRKFDDVEVLSEPAHRTGANALAVDNSQNGYLISGGADSSILLWDLEEGLPTSQNFVHRPIGAVKKSPSTHKYGITHLSFYPFDSLTFLSSSYDHTLKVTCRESLAVVCSFNLDAVINSHGMSPIANNRIIACATQQPAIRLVDVGSGANIHALAGHDGAVLSVAWSPCDANILASGGNDGVVRLWDIRRSVASLGVLDLEDASGIEKSRRPRERGKSHAGACNGVVWSEDGAYIISTGHDDQVRVWDAKTWANTLTHFGPTLKNPRSGTVLPIIVPRDISSIGQRVMIYPNGKELLMFDMLEGTLLQRLPVPRPVARAQGIGSGPQNYRQRITSMAFRTGTGHVEMYSAHSDGFIRLWAPRTVEDAAVDEEEAQDAQEPEIVDERQKKRQALDQIIRDLTKRPITFT